MTRAKQTDDKKKPGRKPWYHDSDGARVRFLQKYLDEWNKSKEAKTTTQFYNAVTVKFVLEFDKDALPKDVAAADGPLDDRGTRPGDHAVGNSDLVAGSDPSTLLSPATVNDSSAGVDPAVETSQTPTLLPLTSLSPATVNDSISGVDPAVETASASGQATPSQANAIVGQTTSEPSLSQPNPETISAPDGVIQPSAPRDLVEDGDKGLDHKSFTSAAKSLGWSNLSKEELAKKRAWLKGRRDKISEWYRVQFRAVTASNSSHSIIDKVFHAESKADRKPVRVADHLVFMDLFYDVYVKAEAEKEIRAREEDYAKWKEGGCEEPERKPPVHVAIRGSVARRILERQSEEFKADIRRQAEERHAEELKAWEKKGEHPTKVNAPQDHAKELSRWGPEVAKFNAAVAEANNMITMTVLVGPNPFKNGQIDTFWSYAGPTYMGLRWPQDDRAAYEAVKKSLSNFGKKVFSLSDRAPRALPTGPQVTPSGWSDESDNTAAAHTSSNQPSIHNSKKTRQPGPGRNSENMKTAPRPKPRPTKKVTPQSSEVATVSSVDPTHLSGGTDLVDFNQTSHVPFSGSNSTTFSADSDPTSSAAPPVNDTASVVPDSGPIIPPGFVGSNPTTSSAESDPTSSATPPVDGTAPVVPDSGPMIPPGPTVSVTSDTGFDLPGSIPQEAIPDMSHAPPPELDHMESLSPPPQSTFPVHTSPSGSPPPTSNAPQVAQCDDSYAPDSGTTKTPENPTVWNHPDLDRFWPEMRMFLGDWIAEIHERGWGQKNWVSAIEDLLEVFIEYEGEFRYTEDNGNILSKLELHLFKDWVKLGRPAILKITPRRNQTDDELMEKLLSGMAQWFDDVVPGDGDKEGWAPLDCVSGKNGAWKFVCFMIFIVFHIGGQDDGNDGCRIQLATWIGLAERMKETFIKVIRWGCQAPKKRKLTNSTEDQQSPKRVTRRQAAQQKETESRKSIRQKSTRQR
ncbi:hypothetical protein K435DRAFT_863885 [Dendrothele bispora CBS 962.96]|uniref:Uncharacterized protein n=1 Tax=Dendrothele bispora (strain CBS 962.96) TaxID=1314807 RepID=A0A4S8LNI7_DENBC|nr:hypothetical protein K435DRAFT_863885 [Dendrothele bispora CBS 962.96]